MPSVFANAVALQREIFAVSLDPLTNRECKGGFLRAGTLVENPHVALQDAVARGVDTVVLRARDRAGRMSLERVAVESLRAALPKAGSGRRAAEAPPTDTVHRGLGVADRARRRRPPRRTR